MQVLFRGLNHVHLLLGIRLRSMDLPLYHALFFFSGGGLSHQDRQKSGSISKVQWANGLKLVLQLDVPFLSYVVGHLSAYCN